MLAALRLVWISLVLIALGLVSAPRLVYLWVRSERRKLLQAAGVVLAQAAENLGPAATKIAQIASYRGDLLPTELISQLSRTQDNVRPPPQRHIRRALEIALGQPTEKLFLRLDDRPIAAGSIAVVLRARTLDNEDVAVKVVRPGVEAKIQADLRLLRWIAGIISRWPSFRAIPIIEAFDLIAELVAKQCDMEREACSAARLQELLRGEVLIPVPRMDLTNSSVLTMRYLEGRHKICDSRIPQYQYRRACRMLLRAVYRMIFEQGLVHCDLHPGNISVREDGRVILYDFGLTASLDTSTRLQFREFFLSVAFGDHTTAAQVLLQNAASRATSFNEDAFREELKLILARRTGQRAGEFLVVGFVKELFDLQYRHGLHGSPGFTSAIWALGTFEGLVRERYSDLDFQAEARPFMTSTIFGPLQRASAG
jgi:ubiquinone biosynthesis protein